MLDSTFNKENYTENNYLTEVAYLNGIRIIDNNLDDKRTIVGGRGLLRNSQYKPCRTCNKRKQGK